MNIKTLNKHLQLVSEHFCDFCLTPCLHSAGTQWELPTNLHPNMSGLARIQLPGYSVAATILGWCDTTAKRWPSSRPPTCAAWECCSTTTLAPWPSTTLWAPSTCTLSICPSPNLSAPFSTCGTNVWQCSLACPSQTTWRVLNPSIDLKMKSPLGICWEMRRAASELFGPTLATWNSRSPLHPNLPTLKNNTPSTPLCHSRRLGP